MCVVINLRAYQIKELGLNHSNFESIQIVKTNLFSAFEFIKVLCDFLDFYSL